MTACTRRYAQQGFSLIEMAVVLMILGTLLSGVLLAVTQTTESNRRTTARTQLRVVEEALYGYAQAYGHLPCPSSVASAGAEDDPFNDGDCGVWHGFVPSATLDIAGTIDGDGLLLDPWLNPLRYSVANLDSGGSGYAFTSTAGFQALYANTALLTAGATLICVSDSAACSAPVLADTVPAVIFSMGADWSSTTSANELENSDGTDNQFVSTTYTEDLFDDQLIWLSPYILFNRLIDAGKLP